MNFLNKISPGAWLFFGFIAFPIGCFASEMLGWVAFGALGLFRGHRFPQFGWGGLPGLFLGAPLGVVTALCSANWKNGNPNAARLIAGLGGITIGGWWLRWLLNCSPFVWIGDFGFAVTPLTWAAGLILFAVGAKSPQSPD